jgi:hypothetical protein
MSLVYSFTVNGNNNIIVLMLPNLLASGNPPTTKWKLQKWFDALTSAPATSSLVTVLRGSHVVTYG